MSTCPNSTHPINPNLTNPNGSIVPSPTPPWHRPVVSPLTNTIFGDDTIQLNCDTTYFDSTQIRMVDDAEDPYNVVLPNGNYRRQTITLAVRSENINPANTATFIVTGNIAGMTALKFNSVSFSAILQWDGNRWMFMGGNAEAIA